MSEFGGTGWMTFGSCTRRGIHGEELENPSKDPFDKRQTLCAQFHTGTFDFETRSGRI